jgi:Na+/citrate or Na+/malate symporter
MLLMMTIVAVDIAILRYAKHAGADEMFAATGVGGLVGMLVGWHHRRRWMGILLGILVGGIAGPVALSETLSLTTEPSWQATAAIWVAAVGLASFVGVWNVVRPGRVREQDSPLGEEGQFR